MTELLFNSDSYMKEADATIAKIDGNKLYLDKTIFFAFSGGQQSDGGTIDDVAVVELQKEGKDEIAHVMESLDSFKDGQQVRLKLDWEKRHKLMRIHSAAHIVGLLFWGKLPDTKMIGSNVSVDKSRLDYELVTPISEILPELEKESNAVVDAGLEIKTYAESDDSDRRVWEIPAKNMKMPCGGTHVKNTSEIGVIKLKRKNIGAGKERIEVTLP